MEFWICGRYLSGKYPNTCWDFQGLFTTKKLALIACRDSSYFIFPVILNENLPEEISEPPNFEYFDPKN